MPVARVGVMPAATTAGRQLVSLNLQRLIALRWVVVNNSRAVARSSLAGCSHGRVSVSE